MPQRVQLLEDGPARASQLVRAERPFRIGHDWRGVAFAAWSIWFWIMMSKSRLENIHELCTQRTDWV
jgi:hypothetical protein